MISTKGRYALRVMIDLAEHPTDGYIPLKDVAQRQDISKKYLEIIVKDLVNGKMVSGISGRGGGYKLCRAPQDYTIGEILELMEGTLATVACLTKGAPACSRQDSCKTISMWREYDEMVRNFFYSKKLSDFVDLPKTNTVL